MVDVLPSGFFFQNLSTLADGCKRKACLGPGIEIQVKQEPPWGKTPWGKKSWKRAKFPLNFQATVRNKTRCEIFLCEKFLVHTPPPPFLQQMW